jgi:hydrogenase nickel incorporation protein HypA/HybF
VHELGFAEAILDAALRRAAGRRVARVRVRVGSLHRLAGPAMDQAFAMVAGGTEAEDAALDLVVVPVTASCRTCGHREQAEELVVSCPRCGGSDLEVAGGDDLVLESIELEASK